MFSKSNYEMVALPTRSLGFNLLLLAEEPFEIFLLVFGDPS